MTEHQGRQSSHLHGVTQNKQNYDDSRYWLRCSRH